MLRRKLETLPIGMEVWELDGEMPCSCFLPDGSRCGEGSRLALVCVRGDKNDTVFVVYPYCKRHLDERKHPVDEKLMMEHNIKETPHQRGETHRKRR